MKSFLLAMICSFLLLQSCKKEVQKSSELNISGFGAVAFASGDAISIYGTGFDSNPANNIVSFNGVNGEVATASPNRLQVIAPLLTTSGKITVTVHGKSVTSPQTFTIVNVLQGTYTNSFILTADKKYLLRGNVIFSSKLTIEAGTVIYGEKLTHSGLTASDVDFEGTPAKPIIFTSDQAPGSRYPGDWTGITITANQGLQGFIPNGILQYVRVEYAGYHAEGHQGSALNIVITENSTYQYLQASYSAGAGITANGNGQTNASGGFMHHLVAFGCSGDDFRFATGVVAQYGLGLKDPYFADVLRGNGIVVAAPSSDVLVQISNFTLVGYNPEARNILNAGSTITNDAGSGIVLGEFGTDAYGNPQFFSGTIAFYNSVFAASWRAGMNFNNANSLRSVNVNAFLANNYITGTSRALFPLRGGAVGSEGFPSQNSGFTNISADPNLPVFAASNDTTKVLSFSKGRDDLGIKNLTDYSKINNPGVLPAAGSILLKGAIFPLGSDADSPFFNKDITYVGAFGTQDWTQPWCNFNPQITQY